MRISEDVPFTWEEKISRITSRRKERLEEASRHRTNFVKLVVQDVHNPHNVSACLRSAEAFGVKNVDVVHLDSKYKPTVAARGVANWLDINLYQNIEECAEKLHQDGYAIAAAMPDPSGTDLRTLPTDKPIALLFGNEHEGVSEAWKPYIDHYFTIPMVGLVESMNISVCAAISLFHITNRCKNELGEDQYFLKDSERTQLLNKWAERIK